MGWREEVRADKRQAAELAIERDQAAATARLAEQRVAAEQARLDREAAAADRRAAEQQRSEARDARRVKRAAAAKQAAAWCGEHVIDLLFVPVIVVPALLAWTAMAEYGHDLYGTPGWLLPMFSEAAMWCFAGAVTISRHRTPERPVVTLQAGIAVFGAVAAVLNAMHGTQKGAAAAVVMALVSIAGVVAHQLVTAGPRQTRAERADARISRQVARREMRIRKAATRHAVAELDETGHARLVYAPGTVTLQRRGWARRERLVRSVVPAMPVAPAVLGDDLAADLARYLATDPEADEIRQALHAPAGNSHDAPGHSCVVCTGPEGTGADDPRLPDLIARARQAIAARQLPTTPSRRELQQYLGVRTVVAGAVRRALGDDGPTLAAC